MKKDVRCLAITHDMLNGIFLTVMLELANVI